MAPRIPKWVLVLSGLGATYGAVVLYKDTQGVRYKSDEKISGKTVIITGASAGIGKATAMNLAQRGGRILMACRNMEKCGAVRDEIIETTFNKNVHCRKVDLASLASIREFAKRINEEEKHVDVLINNAGMMADPNGKRTFTQDGFEMQIGVNYLSHFLLTNLLLDKLKASSPSRIINVVSFLHREDKVNFKDLNSATHYDPKLAYMQSKFAQVMFSATLSQKIAGTNVSTYSVYPGLTNGTELGRHMRMNKNKVSKSVVGPFVWFMFHPMEKAVQTIVYCAVNESIGDKSGLYWRELEQRDYLENKLVQENMDRLWSISEHWTAPDSTADNN